MDKELCGHCSKDDRVMDMIQCDQCNQWWHMGCVDVNEEDADKIDFVCPGGCGN